MLLDYDTSFGGYSGSCDSCGDNGTENLFVSIDTEDKSIHLAHSYGCYNRENVKNENVISYLIELAQSDSVEEAVEQKELLSIAKSVHAYLSSEDSTMPAPKELEHVSSVPFSVSYNEVSQAIEQGNCFCGKQIEASACVRYLFAGSKNFVDMNEKFDITTYCPHEDKYELLYSHPSLDLTTLPSDFTEIKVEYNTMNYAKPEEEWGFGIFDETADDGTANLDFVSFDDFYDADNKPTSSKEE